MPLKAKVEDVSPNNHATRLSAGRLALSNTPKISKQFPKKPTWTNTWITFNLREWQMCFVHVTISMSS